MKILPFRTLAPLVQLVQYAKVCERRKCSESQSITLYREGDFFNYLAMLIENFLYLNRYKLQGLLFGVRSFNELCGLKWLYSSRQALILSSASSRERNQFTFKHSSLKLPLKDSIKGLSVGFPGLEKSKVTLFS